MRKGQSLINHLLKGILTLLLFLIGWEWLDTLPVMTDTATSSLYIFQVLVGVVLLIAWLIPWEWVKLFLSLLFTLFWFYVQQAEGEEWWSFWFHLWKQWKESFPSLAGTNWLTLDPPLRTVFFLFALMSVALLLYGWVVERGRAILFLVLSFIWIGVLDTFFLYDGSLPAVKLFIYAFLMLAINALWRNPVFLTSNGNRRELIPWAALVLALLVGFSGIGFIAPKAAPSWPDPVSFLTTLKESSGVGGGGVQVTGYGQDDSRLGGAFVQSEEVAFTATVEGDNYPAHYWRGESKDTYTGQGWVKGLPDKPISAPDGVMGFYLLAYKGLPYKTITEHVTYTKPNTLLFTSGQPYSLYPQYKGEGRGNGTAEGITFDPNSVAVTAEAPFTEYTANSLIPVIDERRLIEVSDRLAQGTLSYPESVAPYLQLPDTLPARVKELAAKVVGNETNAYKKAKAIERFLRWGNIYRYETQDVPYPKEGEDFVDQFLFQTKRGYCDHFSTSMVVMLRAQGIPARWVKGYAFGELKRNDEGKLEVTVRQKDAHSWVEAYFPEIGWVPFEATASFFPPYEVVRDPAETDVTVEQQMEQEMPRPDEVEKAQQALAEVEKKQAGAEGAGADTSGISVDSVLYPLLILMVILIALGLFFALRNRERLIFRWRTRRLLRMNGTTFVLEFYRLILSFYERIVKRPSHLTVREYGKLLPLKGKEKPFMVLTRHFERVRYGEKEPLLPKEELIHVGEEFLTGRKK